MMALYSAEAEPMDEAIGCSCVWKWGRLWLPNGQIAHSIYIEETPGSNILSEH